MKEAVAPVNKRNVIKPAASDRVFAAIVGVILVLLTMIMLYPLLYVLSASFSSANAVSTGKVVLWPVDFSLEGYQRVFDYSRVWIGYRNTLAYTLVGTAVNIAMTMMCAYPLARRGLPHKGFFTFIFTFTMIFGGGLIPSYLLNKDLGLVNTFWVMIIPGAMAVYQMILARTFIANTIPEDLIESAKLDGCSDIRFFWQFVLPLSQAVIAVIALQYAVGHWNSYFNAMIYLQNNKLYPLQIFLREILIMSQMDSSDFMDDETAVAIQGMAELIKYALIVVSTAPILCLYPFLQKYFVKGVMIGSLKG